VKYLQATYSTISEPFAVQVNKSSSVG